MFEGYCIHDGEYYCQTELELQILLVFLGYKRGNIPLDRWNKHLTDMEVYYWTDWHHEPFDEWHQKPTPLDIISFIFDWIDQNVDEIKDDEEQVEHVIFYDELKGYLTQLIGTLNL
jgi:hypothetical protein